ncbi:uncharacterized protein HD556DRAFT_1411584 [Suillus plorans]|uniref:Uncharacterized protein n=1 Tax=Suillus plorans TaxID=116603 RepID=A0A9P7AD91_9AGAM|nr:uncharacterized protein HD556DRAFT_1411584 [Suillus plorans]KAG1786991.1 hypothetical protein HD556DRAFT_1411584 [Suillus plorans]
MLLAPMTPPVAILSGWHDSIVANFATGGVQSHEAVLPYAPLPDHRWPEFNSNLQFSNSQALSAQEHDDRCDFENYSNGFTQPEAQGFVSYTSNISRTRLILRKKFASAPCACSTWRPELHIHSQSLKRSLLMCARRSPICVRSSLISVSLILLLQFSIACLASLFLSIQRVRVGP